ncbi:MAG: hypothetical protein OXF84_08400 [Bacteroidetes bacterium]|nr:hypothetical protein [Bacteroidota bacterium]
MTDGIIVNLPFIVSIRFFWLLSIGLQIAIPALAQQGGNRLLPTNDSAYEYILRLQRRGHLLDLNPTALPYQWGEITNAIHQVDTTRLSSSERHWMDLLQSRFQSQESTDEDIHVGYSMMGAVDLLNSERMDMVRPIGNDLNVYWHASLASAYLEAGPAVAELSVTHSNFYDQDPDGIDSALRLLARSEHSYVGFNQKWISAYIGRWNLHWGSSGQGSTILSDNARSRDQIFLRLGGRRASVTAILSELDSATDGRYYTGRAADDSVKFESTRRFHAAHRWDFRPSRKFMISFMESAIYSGPSSSISLRYLNPVNPFLFVVDNVPKNDDNNGFLAGLLWTQLNRWTIQGQLMVDDLRIQSNTGPETITFALTGSAVYALPSTDIKFTFETVSSRAYNAPQTEGQYIFLNRGIATQFSDYVHSSLSAEFYLDHRVPGLRMLPKIDLLYQGERDMRQPFPESSEVIENLLDGEANRTMRTSMSMMYQPVHWWWIGVDAGYNINRGESNQFIGLVSAGIKVNFDTSINLWDW